MNKICRFVILNPCLTMTIRSEPIYSTTAFLDFCWLKRYLQALAYFLARCFLG